MQHPFVIIPALAAVAIAYRQGNLIADQVLPRVPVTTENFSYLKHAKGDAFATPETRVGRKSAPNQIDWGSELVPASVEDHALDAPIPNSDILAWQTAMAAAAAGGAVATPDPRVRATKLVTQSVQNRREKRAADLVFNPNSYANGNKVVAGATEQWDNYEQSDPLPMLMEYFDSMVMRPNIGVLGRNVATKLRMHPKVCKAVFGNNTDAGTVSLRALADQLELEDIYVGDGWINTAKPGQPPQLARAWGKHAAFLVRNQEADTTSGVTFGYTAQWGDKVAGSIADPDIGMRGGERIRAGESVKELVTAGDLGFFVQQAVA
ncbi:MAG: phage capsid protein [Gammaproteobacteria bacterium]